MAQAPWKICDHYASFLFHAGEVAIVGGLILGIALAAAAVIVAFRPPARANLDIAPNPAPVIDALKAFIQALASAPTWLALFGGGILLVYLASTTAPACT